jgi:hypothetical protein
MKMVRSVTALVATTMLATSVTPAMAQGFPGGFPGGGYGNSGRGWNDGYRRQHRDRGVSAGDVIAGVAIIGVIAAIASAASSSKNRNRDRGYEGNINSEDQAADACAIRVEQQLGNNARVSNIDTVNRTRDGYEVRGTVSSRDYRDNRDDRYGRNSDQGQRFTCSIRYGQVEDVRISDGYAYRGY